MFREPPRLLCLVISGVHGIIAGSDDKSVSLVAGIERLISKWHHPTLTSVTEISPTREHSDGFLYQALASLVVRVQ